MISGIFLFLRGYWAPWVKEGLSVLRPKILPLLSAAEMKPIVGCCIVEYRALGFRV